MVCFAFEPFQQCLYNVTLSSFSVRCEHQNSFPTIKNSSQTLSHKGAWASLHIRLRKLKPAFTLRFHFTCRFRSESCFHVGVVSEAKAAFNSGALCVKASWPVPAGFNSASPRVSNGFKTANAATTIQPVVSNRRFKSSYPKTQNPAVVSKRRWIQLPQNAECSSGFKNQMNPATPKHRTQKWF